MRWTACVASALLVWTLNSAPATAQSGGGADHLSYYTYYKSGAGETIEGLAARHGLTEASLLRMNPYLNQFDSEIPEGTMLSVPRNREAEASSALLGRSERLSRAEQKKLEEAEEQARLKAQAEAKAVAGKGKAKKKESEPDEPDEKEWEHLAFLATQGAPVISARSFEPRQPASRMIRPNGEVVWIPAAKPRPKPKSQVKEDPARGSLSSRKGKAIHEVLLSCRSFMGTPYVWGGQQPGGFDCSGYVQYVFGKHGYRLPRTADIQFEVGQRVGMGQERPGDLVFFETYAPGASHVGVYLGRDYFIHASSSRGVTIDRLSSDFFAQRYLGARRNI